MPQSQLFSWKNSRILIADDEPDMREIFSAWFRGLGCTVVEAADGKEALDLIGTGRFDAIVTDIRMPRLDGIQLVHQLHRSPHYTPIVIFVSGYADLTLPDAFDLGVEAVMSKPCEKKDLINAVHRSLLRRDLVFEPPLAVCAPGPESSIHQDFSSDPTASDVALGRGGVSLNVRESLIRKSIVPDSSVAFSLSFAQGSLTHLAGWGLLRWREDSSTCSRVGIEFLHLDDQSLAQFARWLQQNSPISFIPKDCHSHSTVSASS